MYTPKPFVVITSINSPTEAVERFARWKNWEIVVVGDRKTPIGWACDNVTYLGIDRQYEEFGELARAIPENTYTRKMLGYSYAIQRGATAIFETDDDNIPYGRTPHELDDEISSPSRSSDGRLGSKINWVNIYRCFGAPNCWPRGFPLELVRHTMSEGQTGTDTKPWAITQFLADEDPDVDAIYRMVIGSPVFFAKDRSFILDEGTFCPFNSQATLWLPQAFPLMFLPVRISDRVTDILRGFMAQACLWKTGHSVRYASPVVYQSRNEHVLANDFRQEAALYANAIPWAKTLSQVQGHNAQTLMISAIKALAGIGSLDQGNVNTYEAFLRSANLTPDQ